MILVLDSNEYIDYLNQKNSLDALFSNQYLDIGINDLIIREVIRNLNELQIKKFYKIIFSNNIEFYGQKLPSDVLENFRRFGLKKGDIAIAAFCETIGADYLITENRHFLKSREFHFKILSLKGFLSKFR